MTVRRIEEVERFDIVDDEDGYETTIVVTRNIIDARSMNSDAEIPSRLKDYMTTDGHHVNVKGDDEFEVLDPMGPLIVRRVAE